MKIYFSASIRGGRDDVAIYAEIIELLKTYGTVLTEHIGDKQLSSYGQVKMTDEEIFIKDTNWIKEADIVIAEVTNPSLGVGYELGLADALNKKIVTLYRPTEGKRLSAMIAGNTSLQNFEYKEVSELPAIFDTILK
jgi:nucleoside 2-deoxyribosyltransferase